MPVYQFINTGTLAVVDVYIPITGNVNVYNGENGLETGQWKRDFSGYVVNLGAGIRVKDAHSASEFRSATEGKNMTLGDALDFSAEMSAKRAEKEGIDPVKQRFYEKYEQENGVKHLDVIAAEKKKKMQEAVKK